MNPTGVLRSWRAVSRHLDGRRVAGVLCLLVALFGWGLASPVGASPDENFHLASIWCSHGERDGVCEPGDAADTRRVPRTFPLDVICYAGDPDQSAACQPDQPPGELAITDRGNFAGLYPPLYYWVSGLLVGDSIGTSVVLMRWLNALLFILLTTAVYLLTPPGLRRPLILGLLVTAVPLGVFLVPSINPSGWAILSGATFLVSLLGYILTEERRRRIGLGVVAGLALLVGAGARADAAVFAVIAAALALVLVGRRVGLRRLAYPAVLAVAAVAAFFMAGQSSAVDGAAGQPLSLGSLLRTAIEVPALWTGAVGSSQPRLTFGEGWPWGLGWLDTGMPATVWASMWGLYAAILFLALTGTGRRQILAVGLAGAAALGIPAYMQSASALAGGVQPRYILPLLILVAITATVRLDGDAWRLSPGHRWVLVAIVSVANAVALHTNLRRYVTGIDVTGWNLNSAVEWWWSPLPVSPLALWVLTSVAFAAGAVLLTRELTTAAPAITAPTASARPDSAMTETGDPVG